MFIDQNNRYLCSNSVRKKKKLTKIFQAPVYKYYKYKINRCLPFPRHWPGAHSKFTH